MGNNLGIDIAFEYVIGRADTGNGRRRELGRTERLLQVLERNNKLPNIRKMPDIKKFVYTDLYKQIKANVGLPPTNKLPNENFNLVKALQKREQGLASPGLGSFSVNQHRSIANLYIPNRKEMRLMSLDSKVFICKFDKTGDKLLTACQDGVVRIYDSSKGTYHLKNRIKARDVSWSVVDADFSPCRQFFAYSTWYKSLMVMPVNGNENDCVWIDLNNSYERFAIFSLRYSPCGRKLVGGSNRASIYIADIERQTSQDIRTNRYPVIDINAITYVYDKEPNVILCGCDDGSIKLYDLRCVRRYSVAKPMSLFYGHYDGITYLDPRNDGCHILSNSKDQSIKIWDLRKPSPVIRNQHIEAPDWDYRWDTVPQSFYNPKKNLENDTSIMTYRGHRVSKTLLRAKFSPALQTGQRYIYTGCATGRIIIYDVLTGKIKETIEGHKNVVRDLDWHPQRAEIVSGSWDTHVDLNTFKRNGSSSETRVLKRNSSSHRPPLRRSRRLALRLEKPETERNNRSLLLSDQVLQQDEDGLTFTS